MLRTCSNTDGNKLVIFSDIASYYGDNYILCDRTVFNFYTGLSTCIPQMPHLLLVTLQVSVALSFSLGDIRSAGSTEKNASFADELQIEFSTGVKQVSIEFCIAMASIASFPGSHTREHEH